MVKLTTTVYSLQKFKPFSVLLKNLKDNLYQPVNSL